MKFSGIFYLMFVVVVANYTNTFDEFEEKFEDIKIKEEEL